MEISPITTQVENTSRRYYWFKLMQIQCTPTLSEKNEKRKRKKLFFFLLFREVWVKEITKKKKREIAYIKAFSIMLFQIKRTWCVFFCWYDLPVKAEKDFPLFFFCFLFLSLTLPNNKLKTNVRKMAGSNRGICLCYTL